MSTTIGISGFGAIGRRIFRGYLEGRADLDVAALNGIETNELMAHLLKYDSTYGVLDREIGWNDEGLIVDGTLFPVFHERDPKAIPWGSRGVEVVLECTGVFRDRESASGHLAGGAKKVVISAPGKGDDMTVIYGVNEKSYDPARHTVVSNGSCTTNCLVPVVKVLDDVFGLEWGLMSTVHSYTRDQSILDGPHPDLRRARGAAQSIIPTTTGAAEAVNRALPHLAGRITGIAFRVPTPSVSVLDLTAGLGRAAGSEEVNAALSEAAKTSLKGVLGVSDAPLVSTDFRGRPESAVVDLSFTRTEAAAVKVVAWYDNEWAYAHRMLDIAGYIGERL